MAAKAVSAFKRPDDVRHRQARRQRHYRWFREKVLPRLVLIFMCLLFVTPLYWMVVTALKPTAELTTFPPTLWPEQFRWSNFSEAVNFIPFWRYLANTSIITFFTVLGAVISNPIIAYGFSRIEWPGRDTVFYFVIATIFIPFPVLMVALFDIFARLGWVNTFLPLIVPMFFGNAFWIFLMRQFMMQIPHEISDAARVDGANEFQIFVWIILPLCKPAIAVVAIFAAVTAWNDFLGPLIYLQDESMYTLAIGLQFFRSLYDVEFNLLMAASTLVVLPVVVIFLAFQRFFIEGISLGSVK
ncbi:carbohydrate ABC transporter permease [Rubrobacter taiwanensis]|jgi:multiple sugar transport system permease protein|uniref:Carbohydrate ABC transporter permease n=1 Tax=Rubrobacter taiwanensis TaxID=185139 RepID=A0A4R1BI16_9ACTN|nr:carbohydrate ABC transporter permease [Rubrobacter taiwanensis]TCJ16899.1 carbohydrate ABC transporter permease [Rubrobacter taiwanensis]